MAKKLYTWSTIRVGGDSIPPGEDVTASKLGLTLDQFQQLIDSGAVRDKKYPVPLGYQGSVNDYIKEQLAAAVAEEEEDVSLAE